MTFYQSVLKSDYNKLGDQV